VERHFGTATYEKMHVLPICIAKGKIARGNSKTNRVLELPHFTISEDELFLYPESETRNSAY
jgi:hypothetical protein